MTLAGYQPGWRQQGIGRISTLTFERLCPGDNGFLEYRWHLSSTPWSNLPNLIVQSSLGVAWIQHSNPRDTIFSHSWLINDVLQEQLSLSNKLGESSYFLLVVSCCIGMRFGVSGAFGAIVVSQLMLGTLLLHLLRMILLKDVSPCRVSFGQRISSCMYVQAFDTSTCKYSASVLLFFPFQVRIWRLAT